MPQPVLNEVWWGRETRFLSMHSDILIWRPAYNRQYKMILNVLIKMLYLFVDHSHENNLNMMSHLLIWDIDKLALLFFAAVKGRLVLHHCVVIFVWSSGIIECTYMLFTFENGVPLMR